MSLRAYISRRVVFPDRVRAAAVLVETDSGLITGIAEYDAPGRNDHTYDLGELALCPGFIDPHVHVNSPGRDAWEGFPTASRAAAAAGITTIVDMPLNSLPATTTVAALEAKRAAAAGQSLVDFRFWGGAENLNQLHLIPLAQAGAAGFKAFLVYPGCEGLRLIDEANLRTAMPLITATGLPLLVHAELPGPIDAAAVNLAGETQAYASYLRSRPDAAEVEAIALLITVCREFRTRVHIVHLASALGLPLVRAAKAEGLPLTVETCPHYLYFAAEEIGDGATLLKCAPPIRSRANRDGLREAVLDGTLDLIASDHSPAPPEMKSGTPAGCFATAWGGIASLSLGPSILHTCLPELSLLQMTRLLSEAPAQLAGVGHRKGRIAEGLDADFAVFDPEAVWIPRPEDLHFRHPVSPYLGHALTGRVKQTILRGHTIYQRSGDRGGFPSAAIGREVRA